MIKLKPERIQEIKAMRYLVSIRPDKYKMILRANKWYLKTKIKSIHGGDTWVIL